jgi:hypothetical protein
MLTRPTEAVITARHRLRRTYAPIDANRPPKQRRRPTVGLAAQPQHVYERESTIMTPPPLSELIMHLFFLLNFIMEAVGMQRGRDGE